MRAAYLMLAIVAVTAQTTLPLKAIGPTLVDIKVRLEGHTEYVVSLCRYTVKCTGRSVD